MEEYDGIGDGGKMVKEGLFFFRELLVEGLYWVGFSFWYLVFLGFELGF